MSPRELLRSLSQPAPQEARAEACAPGSIPLTAGQVLATTQPSGGYVATGEPAQGQAVTPHETPPEVNSLPGLDTPRTGRGRPTLLVTLGLTGEVGEELRKYARKHVLAHNRTEDSGSYSEALIKAAQQPIAPDAFRAWVAGRKDKHSIPPSIRAWLDVPKAVQRYHRNPTEAGLRGLYVPQSLRVHHSRGDRLRAGDRFSADDGSVNFVVYVDWPWGGCPCSDRYGVRVGRYQLLVMHDDGTDYVPHFSWIARASDAYRAEDIAAFLHQPFSHLGLWDEALLEQGSWKSHRITELLRLAGVHRSTAYEAPQKPVEGWWNRAWTLLSDLPGQIGRFRGEEEAAASMVRKYQTGSRDPRLDLLSLPDAAAALARVIAQLNATRITSDPLFGSWVPAERWAADLAIKPLRALESSTEPLTRPERHALKVRRWSVHCTAWSPAGESLKYEFYDQALIAHEGREVVVYFDPYDDPVTAAIYSADGRTLLAPRATCISRAPALIRDGTGYKLDWDHGQIARARAAKAAAHATVRREHRTLAPDGKLQMWSTEVRDSLARSVASMSRAADAPTTSTLPEPTDTPAQRPDRSAEHARPQSRAAALRQGGTSSHARPRPDPTDDDLAAIEAAERRAQERGLIPNNF